MFIKFTGCLLFALRCCIFVDNNNVEYSSLIAAITALSVVLVIAIIATVILLIVVIKLRASTITRFHQCAK